VNALTSNASLGGSMVPRCQVTIDTAPRNRGGHDVRRRASPQFSATRLDTDYEKSHVFNFPSAFAVVSSITPPATLAHGAQTDAVERVGVERDRRERAVQWGSIAAHTKDTP
jgi:hypothetical protein